MKRYQPRTIVMTGTFLLMLVALALPLTAQSGSPGLGSQGQNQTQIDPDSQEFDRFIEALQEVQAVQEEVNSQVSQIISESGLSEERFNEIYRATQSPDVAIEDETSGAERSAYEDVFDKISEIQGESQSEMVEAVEENDLSVSRFNELIVAMRRNPELQEAAQERMQ